MVQESPPLGTLIARDGTLKGIALGFTVLTLTGVAILATIIRLLIVDDIWVKLVFVPLLVLIPGFVIRLFVRRMVTVLRGRLAVLRRLADHGVGLDAQLESRDWTTDSEGSRFWTATYTYSYLGKRASVTRSASWSGIKTPHPQTLRVLVDPERPADALVLGAAGSGRGMVGGLLNELGGFVILLWLAGWAFLFFGGYQDHAWGPVVIVCLFVGMPVIWVFIWIVSRFLMRTQ